MVGRRGGSAEVIGEGHMRDGKGWVLCTFMLAFFSDVIPLVALWN